MNEPFDWRSSDRKVFATVAILFPIVVLIGFARSYYLKFAFGNPPLPSALVHIHGALMTTWVGLIIGQIFLIRSKNARVHMRLGMISIALAVAIIVVGFFTAVAGAKYPSPTAPPDISPLSFLTVPLFDLAVFAGLFAAAIYYRRRPANHKRLMLLMIISLLPPAVGRLPVDALQAAGPLFFFGVPAALACLFLVYDTWRNRKLSVVFLVGAALMIVSYPLRMMLSTTEPGCDLQPG